jgi:hypothetical protein
VDRLRTYRELLLPKTYTWICTPCNPTKNKKILKTKKKEKKKKRGCRPPHFWPTTPKGEKKEKKTEVWVLGRPDHSQELGVFSTTPYGRYGGGRAIPEAFEGGFGHPKLVQNHTNSF